MKRGGCAKKLSSRAEGHFLSLIKAHPRREPSVLVNSIYLFHGEKDGPSGPKRSFDTQKGGLGAPWEGFHVATPCPRRARTEFCNATRAFWHSRTEFCNATRAFWHSRTEFCNATRAPDHASPPQRGKREGPTHPQGLLRRRQPRAFFQRKSLLEAHSAPSPKKATS
jgi:hypothetical protein